MAKNHFFSCNAKLHHTEPNATEHGKCLVGHAGNFSGKSNKNSCNYRYQAYEQATSEKSINDYLHSYKKDEQRNFIHKKYKMIKTSAYETKSEDEHPAHYCSHIPPPQPGDWDVGGPNRTIERTTFYNKEVTIKKGMNFTQDTWPYWNNAHHLIPKGTLKKEIMNSPDKRVSKLMEEGLLTAEYNVNHKKNMLFLPQDKVVAYILNVPRHIHLKEEDDYAIRANCTSHPVYDEMVKSLDEGLTKIITNYESIISQAVKDNCKEPKFSLDKRKLEALSAKLLKLILTWEPGRSLDSNAKKIIPKKG